MTPAFQDLASIDDGPSIHGASSDLIEEGPVQDLLTDQLRDILHAEKQLLKALPKMGKAARTIQLQRLMETHLQETEIQVERLTECLKILGAPARAKPCKGMAGLVEEGEEVMDEGKKKEDAAADLALIGAALRVEHYEVAAYTTARKSRSSTSHPGHRRAADDVARRGAERRTASRPGGTAADVGGENASSGRIVGVSRCA